MYGSPALLEQLRDAYVAAGTRFDMGKSCLRFRDLDGIELDAVGDVLAGVTPEQFIAQYEASRSR